MDTQYKNRNEISRLVSDRQSYISSLELKLEKFTQNTQSFVELKEKIEKISSGLNAADEKIQGLNWVIKQQHESHQQQIKQLGTRYEELYLQMSNISLSKSWESANPVFLDNKKSFIDFPKLAKDLEDLVSANTYQIKSEIEGRLDIISSKNSKVIKALENKLENSQNDNKNKLEFDKSIEKAIEKNCEAIKDLEYKLEAVVSLHTERYKELSSKLIACSASNLSEEMIGIKHKIIKIDEFKRKFEENEIRRELEVKEASQSAWNVENQVKSLEKELKDYRNSYNVKDYHKYAQDFISPIESKLNYVTNTLKKYLLIQKSLHRTVESLSKSLRNPEKGLKPSSQKRTRPKASPIKANSSYSPSLNSSRVSILKNTSRKIPQRPGSTNRSRIDILYDELSSMFT
jgi:hypothetical protein